MIRSCTLVVVILFVFAVGCKSATKSRSDVTPPPALADTESRVLTSTESGREFQVSVALPRGYHDSNILYPVLYVVDANGQLGTVVESARLMRFEDSVPELIIVGIGYPVGRMWNAQSPRSVDLTPTNDAEWVRQRAIDFPQFPAPDGSGGGPAFLRFISDELVPVIEEEYRVDRSDRALYGHSFGGLFGVYALLNNEGLFNHFIIASPSLWWNDGISFELESEYSADRNDLPARVFFSVGELEEDERFRMVTNLQQFVRVLEARDYEGLDFVVRYFEGETHNSVIPRSIIQGLIWIYQDS